MHLRKRERRDFAGEAMMPAPNAVELLRLDAGEFREESVVQPVVRPDRVRVSIGVEDDLGLRVVESGHTKRTRGYSGLHSQVICDLVEFPRDVLIYQIMSVCGNSFPGLFEGREQGYRLDACILVDEVNRRGIVTLDKGDGLLALGSEIIADFHRSNGGFEKTMGFGESSTMCRGEWMTLNPD